MAGASDTRSAARGISFVDFDDMLINMIGVRMVEVAVVQIIYVAVVLNGRMAAAGSMLMGVVGVLFFGAVCHYCLSLLIVD